MVYILEYTDFKKVICDELKHRFTREELYFDLKVTEVHTINTKKDKLAVVDPTRPDAFPVFYLDDIYKYYKECGDIYSTAHDVVNEVKRTFSNIPKLHVSNDIVENNVYLSLINRDKNAEILNMVPNREFYDLAVTYRVKVTETTDFLVTNKLINELNLSEDKLYQAAYKNTPKILREVCCMELDDWYMNELKAALNDDEITYESTDMQDVSEEPIFVLKFQDSSENGSAVILYDDAIQDMADKIDDELIMMFPNSDELLITSEKCRNKVNELFDAERVPQEKFLSDKNYIYNKKTKEITVADNHKVLEKSNLDNVKQHKSR